VITGAAGRGGGRGRAGAAGRGTARAGRATCGRRKANASGRTDEAESCYRKALYLEPRHAEAVTHLALLVERRGAEDEAKVLWSRARRLTAGGAR